MLTPACQAQPNMNECFEIVKNKQRATAPAVVLQTLVIQKKEGVK